MLCFKQFCDISNLILSDHVLDYMTIHGKSMATTNDEFTETALQRFSKTEKRFGFKMTRTFDSKEKLKKGGGNVFLSIMHWPKKAKRIDFSII